MKTRLLKIWEALTTNYWLLPAIMALSAIGCALLTTHWDSTFPREQLSEAGWIWMGSAEGAREVLSAIAGSMITVAGVTFSITIVALAQASSQFGPLLLRNFMRDTGNQLVLGTFIATFVYCLLVLRTVHEGERVDRFVPHISVTCGIVFALASLAVLIYFIHHICEALQAENLVSGIGHELEKTILREFPERLEGDSTSPTQQEPQIQGAESNEIQSTTSGYLQVIDLDGLVRIATRMNVCFIVQRDPGDFVAEGNPILKYEGAAPDEKEQREICTSFIFGRHRTPIQDPDYAVHQLVEVAVRALSPGINDPFTAVTCVDWLGSALNLTAGRAEPPGCLRDEKGDVRVIYKAPSFTRMLDAAFNQIRQNARSNAAVSIRLLETLGHVARRARRTRDRRAIAEHAARIVADCEQGIENAWDLAIIQRLGRKVFSLTESL